jgi:hypothetical protein
MLAVPLTVDHDSIQVEIVVLRYTTAITLYIQGVRIINVVTKDHGDVPRGFIGLDSNLILVTKRQGKQYGL